MSYEYEPSALVSSQIAGGGGVSSDGYTTVTQESNSFALDSSAAYVEDPRIDKMCSMIQSMAEQIAGFGTLVQSMVKSNDALAILIKERLMEPAWSSSSTELAAPPENEFVLLDSVEAVQEFDEKLKSDPGYFAKIVSVITQ